MRRALFSLGLLAALTRLQAQPASVNPCVEFDRLYVKIRDGQIDRQAAHEQVRALLPRIREHFETHGGMQTPHEAWRFPLEGYAADAIGGRNGSGYVADGYDYFDGYKSRGHRGTTSSSTTGIRTSSTMPRGSLSTSSASRAASSSPMRPTGSAIAGCAAADTCSSTILRRTGCSTTRTIEPCS